MRTPSPLCRWFYWIIRQFALQIHWRPNGSQGQQRKYLKLVGFGSRDKNWQVFSWKTWIAKIIIVKRSCHSLGLAELNADEGWVVNWRRKWWTVARITEPLWICVKKKNSQMHLVTCHITLATDSSQNHSTIVNTAEKKPEVNINRTM